MQVFPCCCKWQDYLPYLRLSDIRLDTHATFSWCIHLWAATQVSSVFGLLWACPRTSSTVWSLLVICCFLLSMATNKDVSLCPEAMGEWQEGICMGGRDSTIQKYQLIGSVSRLCMTAGWMRPQGWTSWSLCLTSASASIGVNTDPLPMVTEALYLSQFLSLTWSPHSWA